MASYLTVLICLVFLAARQVCGGEELQGYPPELSPTCGPNCAYWMLERYGNSELSLDEVLASFQVTDRGVSLHALSSCLNSHGLEAVVKERCSLQTLQSHLPAIAHLGSHHRGHFVVVSRIDFREGRPEHVELFDGSSSELGTVDATYFLREWSGHAILVAPSFWGNSSPWLLLFSVVGLLGVVVTRNQRLQAVSLWILFISAWAPAAFMIFLGGASFRGVADDAAPVVHKGSIILENPRVLFPTAQPVIQLSEDETKRLLEKARLASPANSSRRYSVGDFLHAIRVFGTQPATNNSKDAQLMTLLTSDAALGEYYGMPLGKNLLQADYDTFRLRTRGGKTFIGTQPHYGVFFAALGECGVPSTQLVATELGDFRLSSGIRTMLDDYVVGEEPEFFTVACCHYVDSAEWLNKYGERWSFDRLANCLISRRNGACENLHTFYALTCIFKVNEQRPVLSQEVEERVRNHLLQRAEDIAAQLNENHLFGNPHSDEHQLLVTGHILETVAMAPPQLRPASKIIEEVSVAFLDLLRTCTPESIDLRYGPYSHGVRGLLYLSGGLAENGGGSD